MPDISPKKIQPPCLAVSMIPGTFPVLPSMSSNTDLIYGPSSKLNVEFVTDARWWIIKSARELFRIAHK